MSWWRTSVNLYPSQFSEGRLAEHEILIEEKSSIHRTVRAVWGFSARESAGKLKSSRDELWERMLQESFGYDR